MKIVKAGIEVLTPINGAEILKQIEIAARTCYKSEDKITDESAEKLVKQLISRGHEAMLEHASISVKVTCDRGVSHEIVRHRLASYAQESTRYCDYSKDKFGGEITVIEPCFFEQGTKAYKIWLSACKKSEQDYFALLDIGRAKPEEARTVLPNSLKTEIVMTMNLREWRHFLKLRTAKDAHPQMREVANLILAKFHREIPVIFNDIYKTSIDTIISGKN